VRFGVIIARHAVSTQEPPTGVPKETMSGFDVTRADARRSRMLALIASAALSALLLLMLLFARPGTDGLLDIPPVELVVALDTLGAEDETKPIESADLAALDDNSSEILPEPLNLLDLEHAAFTECQSCPALSHIERRVPAGGTLAGLLDDAGIDRVEAAYAIAALRGIYDLRYLRAGQAVNLYLETTLSTDAGDNEAATTETHLNGLSFRPDIERSLTVAKTWDGGFRARETISQFEREMVRASGNITASLYVDALEAGATDRIVVELAGVLAYAIDFQRSIREGDEFDILFERFVDEEGDIARTGDILYARYDGRGDAMDFFRFETPDGIVGYYSGDGESAQRLLMLTPINGARLSSHFGRRRHPVLGYTRNHNGTDFAAPRGTPILASGNGVVERADRFGSFGNYTRIRHANGYKTIYAHQNRFARGIRQGSTVQQGQVIGYVGTTGRSTGPHLHYEVHQGGNAVNPMTLDLPTGRTLTADEVALFQTERDRIIAIRDAAPSARRDRPILPAQSGDGAQ
jgi:murein DD-endopeptidase MepM/ murein hydrolase activator NlpD